MTILPDQSICIGKDGTLNENGDHIYNGNHFKAVFDGATPKGKRLWEGLPGDIYASKVLCEAMNDADPDVCATDIISYLKRGYSVRNVAKLTNKGVSTVQRIKTEFNL